MNGKGDIRLPDLIMEERRRERRERRKRRGRATCRVLWCRKDCTTMYNTTYLTGARGGGVSVLKPYCQHTFQN